MASKIQQSPGGFYYNHIKPPSVLRSFMHMRTASEGAALTSNSMQNTSGGLPPYEADLAATHEHPQCKPLMELHQNQHTLPTSPKKSKDGKQHSTRDDGFKSLHKKTLSSISLKSLAGRDTDKDSKSKDKETKPNKSKKTTNLSKLLSRPKSSKSLRKEAAEQEARETKDKENQDPDTSPQDNNSSQTPPIYAQFSSTYFSNQSSAGKDLADEINLYTPRDYSPGKQRNFYDEKGRAPSLNRGDTGLLRPKSTYLPSSFSLQDISRRIGASSPRNSSELTRKISEARRPSLDNNVKAGSANAGKTVHGLSSKVVDTEPKVSGVKRQPILNDKDVDREFEAMLDRRNIPEHQRGKMRSLTMVMKRDFIRQDCAESASKNNDRTGNSSSNSSADAAASPANLLEAKSKRPRSLTFTLSRGSSKDASSPTKKLKPQATIGLHSRTSSVDGISERSKSFAASGAAAAHTLVAKAKSQLSHDFVSYLRKVRKPEIVEVGRLHKLRIILRNETVAWIEGFIGQGGMEEIVGLLHRTMEVEWREEHEDALLHEVLLCLKALSTTDLALRYISNIQDTLFPALLHLIFDEEKKGPSEFTTRNIITSLLFTYLKSAPISERASRAKTLLTYLKDPEPDESQRPVEFVLEMRRSRPYQVWCKEVVNVTKEVFWIFLHNLNVIVVPVSDKYLDSSDLNHLYMARHFPPELPPVPAAPYVGGVEWDATNYLASHLDIINGILACLPTRDERNALREQLRVSGWEKCMGGTLRLCKEKFYGCVHAALRCWVAAAAEDGWNTRDVRCGPSTENQSPVRKNTKKTTAVDPAPKIEMKLDFGREDKKAVRDDGWL
ncbi:hypothetical protein OIDMADRAFT_159763 [Oidiodendron maius Zn]|uniref:Formin GTPase-binding domain-containing protein n=1 Tax=Oidiodendron maius (strain Zn) TaxID=913774 RepID=A0A0C3HMR7_OIDMZ|nr:hypothetical protein OIDMADRAFT_159763 [Oidiodendron maius Zn]